MRTIFFLILSFACVTSFYSQEEPKQIVLDTSAVEKTFIIDENLMQDIKEDSDFNYERTYTQENWWSNFKRWVNQLWNQFLEAIFGDLDSNSFIYLLTQILPYIIVIGVVMFIIWLFIKLNPGQNVLEGIEGNKVYFSNEEELIKTKDLEKLKNDALDRKNYRLAVRYWYLQTLQNLDQLELIEYEFEKTNADYASELVHQSFADSFMKTTNYYNFAWYGGFDVNEIQFQKINRLFKELQEHISQKNE